MANAQLQNATEAVIKTAAVAGLAYAGAYMAAAGTTPGAYDSSRRSQASSTGQRYCDNRETDPTKYKCTAEFFNGNKVNNAAESQAKVAIRNYWCCPSADLGGTYIGDMNSVCVASNTGATSFASGSQGSGGCVYHGPCIGGAGGSSGTITIGTTLLTSLPTSAGTGAPAVQAAIQDQTGHCGSTENDGAVVNLVAGIFGGVPPQYNQHANGARAANQGGVNLGPSSGLASSNGVLHPQCCVKTDQGKDGALTYDLTPSTLNQPISFCTLSTYTNSDYTCK